MVKRIIIIAFLIVLIIPLNVSCMNQQAQQPTAPAEPPPPDYTRIDAGMKDPSDVVRLETLNDLIALKHKNSIPRLIIYLQQYADNDEVSGKIVGALNSYGPDVTNIVKEKLWNSENYKIQYRAFKILSAVMQPPEFMADVKKRFDELPIDETTKIYRKELIGYYLSNLDISATAQAGPANGTAATGAATGTATGTASTSTTSPVVEAINVLKKADKDTESTIVNTIAAKKDPQMANLLTKIYFANLSDEPLKSRILAVLLNYDSPFNKPKTGYVPLPDLTVFLYSFANNNTGLNQQAYEGLKLYVYNDKDGQILKFIRNFETCSDPTTRARVIELERFIPTRAPLEGEQMPTFTIPAPVKRADVCI